jgi:hypothetical protein
MNLASGVRVAPSPRGWVAAMRGLELRGIDEPETPALLDEEAGMSVAGLGDRHGSDRTGRVCESGKLWALRRHWAKIENRRATRDASR